MKHKEKNKKNFFNKYSEVWISLFLVLATLSVYWQVRNYEFINYEQSELVDVFIIAS